MILDPFCGCATTCVAAHNHGRNWVGIDISEKAADLVVDRISDIQGSLFQDIIHRTDIPQRNDLGKGIIYVSTHLFDGYLLRIHFTAHRSLYENAPPRADAPIPEACNTFADALISDGHKPYT